ncbi:WD repeat-containing protein 44 [Linum grandiflorum]
MAAPPKMDRKRTLTMNWDALGDHDDDDDDRFFDCNRLSTAVPSDLPSSGSDDDDDFEESRASFSTTLSSNDFRNYSFAAAAMSPQYDIWMAAPGSITERRKRLLQGMGLAEEKAIVKMMSREFSRAVTRKIAQVSAAAAAKAAAAATSSSSLPSAPNGDRQPDAAPPTESEKSESPKVAAAESKHEKTPSSSHLPVMLVRSRSDGDIESMTNDKKRKEEVLGLVSKQRITRTTSLIIVSHARLYNYSSYPESVRIANHEDGNGQSAQGGGNGGGGHKQGAKSIVPGNGLGAFFLIKNLDTGKEFVVNEYDQNGSWNRVSDLQTGKQLTMEEFEKSVGHSPVVKELMRREDVANERKLGANNYFSKSLRMSKRRGAALVKSIKGVAHSMSMSASKNERVDRDLLPPIPDQKGGGSKNSAPSGWIKVRLTGKSHKELSALHLCQEIQAHEGSIWTLKFSSDARYLASGGEDKVIHIWEVQECEVLSLHDGHLTPLHPSLSNSVAPTLGEAASTPSMKKKKKGSASKKSNPIPEYVHVPETVFALSEKPICSFTGHLDDVLDLSWAGSQLLLSSSMDKTVRLWDMESKSCLKMFAHNDYVTCIQFNPMNDQYFLSGSLDNKIRIWSVPDRQLVDWTDLHEMVTAVCYTPDGQGAWVGSHKGTCRMYSLEDCKLNQTDQVDIQKKKASGKKITGFQFSPGNPSEVLITSADSRIRIMDGKDEVHKFRGFKNVNSQIAASFTLSGKHVVCASEDSNIYVWKREEGRPGKGKNVITSRGWEAFQCKDVSVAIPFPGTVKGDPPPMPSSTAKSKSKRRSSSPTKEDSSTSSKRSQPEEEATSAAAAAKKKPPLPKKQQHKENNNNKDDKDTSSIIVKEEDNKNKDDDKDGSTSGAEEKSSSVPPEEEEEEQSSQISQSTSGIGESNSSAKLEESPSMSMNPPASSSSSWSLFEGSSHGSNSNNQASAWGLVIVAATSGGEIKAFQNFGMPRRMGRQSNLF